VICEKSADGISEITALAFAHLLSMGCLLAYVTAKPVKIDMMTGNTKQCPRNGVRVSPDFQLTNFPTRKAVPSQYAQLERRSGQTQPRKLHPETVAKKVQYFDDLPIWRLFRGPYTKYRQQVAPTMAIRRIDL